MAQMPWPHGQKSQTRSRIVDAASTALRAKGVAGVDVADVMASAGLTHGGFYAHFRSRDDLLAEALDHASRQSLAALARSLAATAAKPPLQTVIDAYLCPRHVVHPEAGCPVAAVGTEIPRTGGRMRRVFSPRIRGRLYWLRGLLPAGRSKRLREEQAVGTLACMVGGLVLARAVGGKESAALLEACRRFLQRATGESSDAAGRIRTTRRRVTRARRGAATEVRKGSPDTPRNTASRLTSDV